MGYFKPTQNPLTLLLLCSAPSLEIRYEPIYRLYTIFNTSQFTLGGAPLLTIQSR